MKNKLWFDVLMQVLFLAFFVVAGSITTDNLAGRSVAMTFLYSGVAALLTLLPPVIFVRYRARTSAYFAIIYHGLVLLIGPGALFICLSFPLFFVHGLFSSVGLALTAYFEVFQTLQLWQAQRLFEAKWNANYRAMLGRIHNPRLSVMNIAQIFQQLELKPDIYLPPLLQPLRLPFYCVLILGMIVGLNLRNVFPEVSALAWGIPALTALAVFVQMAYFASAMASSYREGKCSANWPHGRSRDCPCKGSGAQIKEKIVTRRHEAI